MCLGGEERKAERQIGRETKLSLISTVGKKRREEAIGNRPHRPTAEQREEAGS